MRKIKSRVTAYLFLLGSLCLAATEQPKLTKIKVNDDISIMAPKEWIPMEALDFTERYPSVRAPLAAYTNQERTADFSINISATQWPDADLKLSQQFFKASLYNMFDRVEMIEEGIHEVNKKRFIFFEFESRVNGNKQDMNLKDPVLRYTYIQYLVEPSRTLVFSFNCPKRMREEWQSTAREMMQSISVKSSGAKSQPRKK